MTGADPLAELSAWIDLARSEGLAEPASVAFVTVGENGQPSVRTVTLKRIEPDALIFTTAKWTRKAREIESNPKVALLFHWPSLGRQIHIGGEATWTESSVSDELFAARDLGNQRQTIISRQGEEIEDLEPLRAKLAEIAESGDGPPARPDDWGALRVTPNLIEFWIEDPHRLHERRLYRRSDARWEMKLLAP